MMRAYKPIFLLLFSGLLGSCAMDGQGLGSTRSADKNAQAAKINLQLGVGYLRQGRDERALQKLKRALKYDNRLVVAHSVIAVLYGEMGEDELAKEHFKMALQLAPNDAEVHNNYGTYLCHRRQLAAAMKEFKLAWSNPRYHTPEVAYANAGVCARYIPDKVRAEQLFRRALQIRAKYPLALLQLANLMFEEAKYKRARGYLLRYQAVAKDSPQVLSLGIRIEEKSNNKAKADQYRRILLQRFPDSDEARLLVEKGVSDGQ